MARKAKQDQFTTLYVDRHGKERCRFRRRGIDCQLPHPSAKGYREAYQRALDGLSPQRTVDGRTVSDLLTLFYRSVGFKKGAASWQRTRRQVYEAFREEFGNIDVRHFRSKDIDVILANKMEKRRVGRRWIGGTSAAERLREQLDLLFRFAIKQEWIKTNPVEGAEEVDHRGQGFHEWTEEEISAYRNHFPLGTKGRLAMELILWTGKRRSDAHRAAPPKGGRIAFTAKKTGKGQDLPVAPPLQAAIDAMSAVGLTTLLVTEYGKPFTVNGFGNWFRKRCDEAGLPQCSAHGLRKALARRAADAEVQQQGLKALGQWSGDREVAIYVQGANQKRLAESALDAVLAWEREANIG